MSTRRGVSRRGPQGTETAPAGWVDRSGGGGRGVHRDSTTPIPYDPLETTNLSGRRHPIPGDKTRTLGSAGYLRECPRGPPGSSGSSGGKWGPNGRGRTLNEKYTHFPLSRPRLLLHRSTLAPSRPCPTTPPRPWVPVPETQVGGPENVKHERHRSRRGLPVLEVRPRTPSSLWKDSGKGTVLRLVRPLPTRDKSLDRRVGTGLGPTPAGSGDKTDHVSCAEGTGLGGGGGEERTADGDPHGMVIREQPRCSTPVGKEGRRPVGNRYRPPSPVPGIRDFYYRPDLGP